MSSLEGTTVKPDHVRTRLHGLEWLRAIAAVLVVFLHAGIPYFTHLMPGLVWSIQSDVSSPAVTAFGWYVDSFIMPLFFLMSGYFAARLYKHRGADGFALHRLKRLGGPLLFGIVLILPLDLYAWLLGWAAQGKIPLQKLSSLKLEPEQTAGLLGLSHLWFLQYVLSYCLLVYAFRKARQIRRQTLAPSIVRIQTGNQKGWILLTAAVALCSALLWSQPRILLGFRHAFLPFATNLLFFSVPFALGWCWEKAIFSKWSLRPHALCLAGGVILFACTYPLLLNHLAKETLPIDGILLPTLFVSSGMLTTCGAFGLALNLRFKRNNQVVEYVAQASFWIYLLHHPVVGLSHVSLLNAPLSAAVKFLISGTTVLTFCLLTYEVGVRGTALGELLNGVRIRRSVPLPESSAERRTAA